MGYAIIPKPNCSDREGILVVASLTQSTAALRIELSPFNLSPFDRSLDTNRDAVTAPFHGSLAINRNRSLVHSSETIAQAIRFPRVFGCFSPIK